MLTAVLLFSAFASLAAVLEFGSLPLRVYPSTRGEVSA